MSSVMELLNKEPGTLIRLSNPIRISENDTAAAVILETLAVAGYSIGETIDILADAMFWAKFAAAAYKVQSTEILKQKVYDDEEE